MSLSPVSTFPLNPPSGQRLPVTLLKAPREITIFSYDDAHHYHDDDRSLRYYYTPSLPAKLSEGFDTFQKHDDSVDEHLDGLLKAIMELERRTGEKVKADAVTWRGMMTKVMAAPFENRDGFEMNAVRFQGTIFIEENNAYKQTSRRPMDKRGEMMSYWGYKFETLSTLPRIWDDCSRPEIENRHREIVNNEAQFCSIVKTGFGDVRVVMGGEVDAVWDVRHSESLSEPQNYVELKTSRIITSERDQVNFERKLLRIWAQSFLLGVPRIMVGFRDDDGILRKVEEFETQKIPNIAKKSGRKLWDGNYAIDFAGAWLAWLKSAIPEEEEGVVWRIRKEANGRMVELVRTEEKSFLTEEFVAWRATADLA